MTKPVETYVIRHKVTGEFLTVPSGKSSWKAVGHAKNAWSTFGGCNYYSAEYNLNRCNQLGVAPLPAKDWKGNLVEGCYEFPKFDQQDVYEIVKLKHESETVLGEATRLLTMCLGRCDYQVQEQIEAFLKKQENRD